MKLSIIYDHEIVNDVELEGKEEIIENVENIQYSKLAGVLIIRWPFRMFTGIQGFMVQ
jgi:hypothetical protein